ncbi:rod shape-determining protein RodA [Sporolactobacillus shoreae]|uniref:Rod shape-determining protein RodA n=1 Tax=Sporolactobacillus shoreae TaxID=1465501 RepID=A0A4Z0GU13_9BACL|nr:FtsW/RodA/SpoVE family cell cycle protein [Sporolactobacillus shoreae]TGB00107.1 rod shape-determining protein RodA [Sporolactobacillus shoreae]
MDRDSLYKLDITLFFIIFALACISCVALYYAPIDTGGGGLKSVKLQIMWYVISTIACALVIAFGYDRLKRMHWILYGIGIFMLLGLVLAKHGFPVPLAVQLNGAWGWYKLPGVGNLQPSEFMKLFLIISLASIIDRHNELNPIRSSREDLLLLGKITLVSLPPFLLINMQPDLGSALVIFSIILAMTIVSGIGWKYITGIMAMIIAALTFFAISWFKFPSVINIVLQAHQKDRFIAWQNPYQYQNQEGYQLVQSLNSIGSGQFFNHSFNSSISLPEAYADFIFSVIGGTFGFIGSVTVILLFFLMISRIVKTAIGTHDPFGTYICTGIIGMIMFQVFENIGMTIQVMPITGITLPFLSYGGSSLLSSMLCIGLVQSIRMQSQNMMFT